MVTSNIPPRQHASCQHANSDPVNVYATCASDHAYVWPHSPIVGKPRFHTISSEARRLLERLVEIQPENRGAVEQRNRLRADPRAQ